MSLTGFNFKQAFGREKPHSSVTDWVEIMTAPQTPEESYEGMPELVDAINLQASGPAEAARALRKKLKRGGPHQQYRVIVIMRLLVDNVPEKMKDALSDSQFLDALKAVWVDPYVDKRVKKRLSMVLLGWQEQYKEDPSMSVFARLYGRLKKEKHMLQDEEIMGFLTATPASDNAKAKLEKERREEGEREGDGSRRREQEGSGGRRRRRSFNFERDKPKVMGSIVDASQASSNLINAIVRVNFETDTLEGNRDVQIWLSKAQSAKKTLMRYTQLVENEELIGTMIETHERLEAALNTYTQLITPDETVDVTSRMANATLTDRELAQVYADNDAAVQLAKESGATLSRNPYHFHPGEGEDVSNSSHGAFLHPDLVDLDFNASESARRLPPPLRPTSVSGNRVKEEGVNEDRRGSLSDYSDYESSDGETYTVAPKKRNYVTLSDDEEDDHGLAASSATQPKPTGAHDAISAKADDPFADPFAGGH